MAEGLFESAAASARFLSALGALAMRVGTGAVLGPAIVWPGKSVVSEGAIPGDSGLRYSLNNDEGSLRLLRQSDSGAETVSVAHQGHDGIFFDVVTGTPVARAIGGALILDAASLANATEEAPPRAAAGVVVRAEAAEPQLCPDPTPDVPHGASGRAIAYQAQISAMNNPQRPLPPGLAVSLPDPTTGKNVVFDDCRETDGTMIEAKGPGYADMMEKAPFYRDVFSADWRKQAASQISASEGPEIEWFFAEPEAADLARKIFRNSFNLQNIKVVKVPAVTP